MTSLTFVRFVTARVDRNSCVRLGVFQAAYELRDAMELPAYDREALGAHLQWFEDELDAPDRFARSRRASAAPRAISWYKSTATEHVSRMHAICRILNEHGVSTEMITTTRPGYVVYEDECQVAAEPFTQTMT